jgi:excisionase family DNA binding protein
MSINEMLERPTLTLNEVAEILGISRSSAYRMADNGEIPTLRLGPRIRRVPTKTFLAAFGL